MRHHDWGYMAQVITGSQKHYIILWSAHLGGQYILAPLFVKMQRVLIWRYSIERFKYYHHQTLTSRAMNRQIHVRVNLYIRDRWELIIPIMMTIRVIQKQSMESSCATHLHLIYNMWIIPTIILLSNRYSTIEQTFGLIWEENTASISASSISANSIQSTLLFWSSQYDW